MLIKYLLAAHNILRWLVLAAGAYAVFRAWTGWSGRKTWTDSDASAVRLFVNMLSLQFVAGVLVYATSPLIRTGFSNIGDGMREPTIRYFMVEHVTVMIIAIAVAHIGAAKVRKAASDSARFQTATIWMGIAFAAVAGFVPWGRPLFPNF